MIQKFADWLVYDIFGLDASTALGEAVNFFFYDTIKILILLFFISVIMGIINAYFPIERLRNYLTSRKLYGLQDRKSTRLNSSHTLASRMPSSA